MGYLIKQSSVARPLMFLMIDSATHINGKTGLAPTVTISKNGAAFATPLGAVTELSGGWYKVAPNATDSGTLGVLILNATATGADPCDDRFEVVAFDPDLAAAGAVMPTVSGRTLDISVTGEAGIDWANIGSTTTTVAFTGTTIATTQKVDIETIKTNPVVNAGTITFPTTATLASTTNITAGTGIVLSSVTHTGAVIPTVTTLTNLPAITSNWLTSAGIAASALNGKGDWNTVTPTNLTAAQIATGVWTDTTSGDFTTALSVGKSLMNGVTLGTGLTIATVSGAVGSVTGLVAGNLDAAISSRMASYTQPTGFLATTFPAVIASTTNITAGVITTTTNVTTVNGLAAGVITAASIANDAITDAKVASDVTIASVTGSVGSVTAPVTVDVLNATAVEDIFSTYTLVESYAAVNTVGTPAQLLYFIQQVFSEFTISGTTITVKRLNNTTAGTFTMDSATLPTSRERIT